MPFFGAEYAKRGGEHITNDTTYKKPPEILSANDLASFLRISRAGAYNLLNSKGFPTLHIGNRKLVTMENLLVWMGNHTNSMAI